MTFLEEQKQKARYKYVCNHAFCSKVHGFEKKDLDQLIEDTIKATLLDVQGLRDEKI